MTFERLMRIAIDIDSTLHHYWDLLSDAARRRFGIELPYEEQFTWGITRLKADQLQCCIDETHCAEAITTSEPYPGAVEAVNAWFDSGHFIHVTSHRPTAAHAPTEQWLQRIGLRHHELHCSFDKVTRCQAIGIELLIDDNPYDLRRAADAGIEVATLLHPWNQDVVEEEDVIAAADWPTLAARLQDRLALPAARAA